ncbi:hypothetical protein [Phenylobacterium kunshanense]|uniref:Uncharacterized protein n=1 Tax=Phenylobacterium kunshanense TaxID=1445034 RepID=A0A328BQI9_9CAUL|nr:hypothetical protein [Phenylobacterium kunshanense]RAK68771.1 hypothetical protein DJ019_01810 [Phenylobacterium kunshanense]
MTGPFAFLRRLFVRGEPLTESERVMIACLLIFIKRHAIMTFADLTSWDRPYMRLALRHGYADDGTAGRPFYRVTPKGERFLQEFER